MCISTVTSRISSFKIIMFYAKNMDSCATYTKLTMTNPNSMSKKHMLTRLFHVSDDFCSFCISFLVLSLISFCSSTQSENAINFITPSLLLPESNIFTKKFTWIRSHLLRHTLTNIFSAYYNTNTYGLCTHSLAKSMYFLSAGITCNIHINKAAQPQHLFPYPACRPEYNSESGLGWARTMY